MLLHTSQLLSVVHQYHSVLDKQLLKLSCQLRPKPVSTKEHSTPDLIPNQDLHKLLSSVKVSSSSSTMRKSTTTSAVKRKPLVPKQLKATVLKSVPTQSSTFSQSKTDSIRAVFASNLPCRQFLFDLKSKTTLSCPFVNIQFLIKLVLKRVSEILSLPQVISANTSSRKFLFNYLIDFLTEVKHLLCSFTVVSVPWYIFIPNFYQPFPDLFFCEYKYLLGHDIVYQNVLSLSSLSFSKTHMLLLISFLKYFSFTEIYGILSNLNVVDEKFLEWFQSLLFVVGKAKKHPKVFLKM
ncbi:hypothetical protein RCL1_002310 [Eukaryota sp. TZLM3-RCL]